MPHPLNFYIDKSGKVLPLSRRCVVGSRREGGDIFPRADRLPTKICRDVLTSLATSDTCRGNLQKFREIPHHKGKP